MTLICKKSRRRHKFDDTSATSESNSTNGSHLGSSTENHSSQNEEKQGGKEDITHINAMYATIEGIDDAPKRRNRSSNGFIRRFAILLVLCTLFQPSFQIVETRCGPVDIRGNPKKSLKSFFTLNEPGTVIASDELNKTHPTRGPDGRIHINCTVIEGSFSIAFMTVPAKKEDFPYFPNLVEITGSLLLFENDGPESLDWIMPNLRVIGGKKLVQNYALVIYKTRNMKNIGLKNLTVIRNGGVRITDNTHLCHTRTIDWKSLCFGEINDVITDSSAEDNIAETGHICPLADCEVETATKKCHYLVLENEKQVQSCWSSTQCREVCAYDKVFNKDNNHVIGPGCDPFGNKCHDECVGGCTAPNDPKTCYACKNFHSQARCVPRCDGNLYALLDRRCVTKQKCLQLNPYKNNSQLYIKATNGLCSDKCPDGYMEDPDDQTKCKKCNGECEIVCTGNYSIDSYQNAQAISRCHIIVGSLTIAITTTRDAKAVKSIGENFAKIHTITGYLSISQTTSLVNLNSFKSLRKIKGEGLHQGKYALSVVENKHLSGIFSNSTDIIIENGSVQFHNNPHLCYEKIIEFMKRAHLEKEIRDVDQSVTSNGYKTTCIETSYNITVEFTTSTSIHMQWPHYDTKDTDHRKFLGYEVFYKEVAEFDEKLNINDDRDACHDSWQRVFIEKPATDVVQENEIVTFALSAENSIKPDTKYAIYSAASLVKHDGARNAVSRIAFATTKYAAPDPPVVTVKKVTESEIALSWEPPVNPNGLITHYIVTWRELDVDVKALASTFCSLAEYKLTAVSAIDKDDVSDVQENTMTVVEMMQKMSSSEKKDTCSRISCCPECSASNTVSSSGKNLPFIEVSETVVRDAKFENAVLDAALQQNKSDHNGRRRRAIDDAARRDEIMDKEDRTLLEEIMSRSKNKLNMNDDKDEIENVTTKRVNTEATVVNPLRMKNLTAIKGTQFFTLNGLKHFTQYAISVVACQDVTAEENYCSSTWKASKLKRTKPIPHLDNVHEPSMIINPTNETVSIRFDTPPNPNGGIKGYLVKLKPTEGTLLQICQPAFEANWTSNVSGVVFRNLATGYYNVEIITISVYGPSNGTYYHEPVYFAGTSAFLSVWTLLLILFGVLLVICLLAYCFYSRTKQHYGDKMQAMNDHMTMNPEYELTDTYTIDEWEQDRNEIDILEEIGCGTFGKVNLGFGHNLTSVNGDQFGECAIKSLLETAEANEKIHFLLEAGVMKNFKSEFIVRLFGVVTRDFPTLCIMELMHKGCLRDYLRKLREKPLPEDVEYDKNEKREENEVLDEYLFQKWAIEIADGMAYLESLKFCHRDLAARNVMVSSNDVVKIGDFGMARDLFYHDYYKPSGKRMMPVRWMSPESLKDGKFDSKSDCWSYGIVLYEMATLGQIPYMGLANEEVLNYIGLSRKIIEKPAKAGDYWYKLMKMCWRYDARDRPSFAQIVHLLAVHTSDWFREVSFVLNSKIQFDPIDKDDELFPLEGDDYEPAYTAEPTIGMYGSAAKEETGVILKPNEVVAPVPIKHDDIQLKEFRPKLGTDSTTSSFPMTNSHHGSNRSLLASTSRLYRTPGSRQQSADNSDYESMRLGINGPLNTETISYDEGDYQLLDAGNAGDGYFPARSQSMSNTNGYASKNRVTADQPAFGEGERLTGGIEHQ